MRFYRKRKKTEWKNGVSQRRVALQKSLSLEETNKVVREVLRVTLCCRHYWRSGMNEKHNEWNLSHLLSLTVCKFCKLEAQRRCLYKLCFFSSVCPCCFISSFLAITVYYLYYWKVKQLSEEGRNKAKSRRTHWWLMGLFARAVRARVLPRACPGQECTYTSLLVRCNLFTGPNMNLQ